QVFIVNKRPVRDRALSAVLKAAYLDILPRERFPVGVFHFTVPGEMVDMNVHPAKAEVRFREMDAVKALLARVVRRVLEQPLQNAANLSPVRVGQAQVIHFPKDHASIAAPAHRQGFGETWMPAARAENLVILPQETADEAK